MYAELMPGLRGKRVLLVPVDKKQHLENALRWLNDPEVTRYLGGRQLPLYRLAEEEWFDRVEKGTNDIVFAILDEHQRHIGFTGLHDIDWVNRTATTGIIIGEKQAWGKGYATEVMALRTSYAFEQLGLHRLESNCFAENLASKRALEKTGYRREGVARKRMFRNGAWHDLLLYGMLADEYFKTRRQKKDP